MQLASLPTSRRALRAAAVTVVLSLVLGSGALLPGANAASPASGSVSPASPTVTWTGEVAQSAGALSCADADLVAPTCDHFSLTVTPLTPPGALDITIATELGAVEDFDLTVYGPDGNEIANSASEGTPPEYVRIVNPPAGTYDVEVRPFAVRPGGKYTGTASLVPVEVSGEGPTPTRTYFFRSETGTYAGDLAADPTATAELRAPSGSSLSTMRPDATDRGEATAPVSGSAMAGAPNTPAFAVPDDSRVDELCLDVWVSNKNLLYAQTVKTNFQPAGSPTAEANQDATAPPSAEPVRLRALIRPSAVGLEVAAGDSFVFSSFINTDYELHYDSPDRPASVTFNPGEGTCAPIIGAERDDVEATSSEVEPPRYVNYPAPAGVGEFSAEPTIGVNKNTNTAMFMQGYDVAAVTWDAKTAPPTANWKVSTPLSNQGNSLDPLLETDPVSGRTVATQLQGFCSTSAYTDDDGETWNGLPVACPVPHGADHQSVGAGRRSDARPPTLPNAHPRAFYYCSQSVAYAFCGASEDGGATYGNSVPIYDITQCGGLHGHVQVAPDDGTVYVPNENCGGQAAVVVSEDGGKTWSVRKVPGSDTADPASHPAVAIGEGGTVYLSWTSGDRDAMAAVSTDKGLTWSKPVDIGATFGINNSAFPVVVAGDDDRAAVAFLGTTTPGHPDPATFGVAGDFYTGAEWHLYVAHTYDTGASWVTIDATPTDPAQRGCLWQSGTTTDACRNLLDFNGIAEDVEGRVLIGWTDGCTGACSTSNRVADNPRGTKATITRLTSGIGLRAAHDGKIADDASDLPCSLRDARGDATLVLLDGVNQPTLDLLAAGYDLKGPTVEFTIDVADLASPPPGDGRRFDWTFTLGGVSWEVRTTRSAAGAVTASLLKAAVAVTPNPASATYDDATGRITITVATPAFEGAATEGARIDATVVEALSRTSTGGGVVYDTLDNSCSVTLVSSADTDSGPSDTTTSTTPSDGGDSTTTTTTTTTTTSGDPSGADRESNRTDTSTPQGYSLVGEDGALYAFGSAKNLGDMRGQRLNAPVIGVAYTPGGEGYWLVAKDGGIFTFGDANFYGSMGATPLNSPVIGMAATATGKGYWLFAADGGIFTFGDAEFFGSMGDQKLNAPVLNMEPLASGRGYWLVAADGGIFSFGKAAFFGSMGDKKLNQPVFDMTSTDVDKGYWLVARDGGVFSFGDAEEKFFGSAVTESPAPSKVIGMDATPDTQGYWIADASGAVYQYGNGQDLGDRSGVRNPAPMVAFAAVPKG